MQDLKEITAADAAVFLELDNQAREEMQRGLRRATKKGSAMPVIDLVRILE